MGHNVKTLTPTQTPSFIKEFLNEIDSIGKDLLSPTTYDGIAPSGAVPKTPQLAAHIANTKSGWVMMQRVTCSLCFIIGAIGLAFSIISTIFLSSIKENCEGYNQETQQFLYIIRV
jgi:hypothetical protein